MWSDLSETMKTIYKKYTINTILHILHHAGLNNVTIKLVKDKQPRVQWEKYDTLIQEQGAIGWYLLQCGIFSESWTTMQYEYAKEVDSTQTNIWLRKIIQETWKFANKRWNCWNQAQHPTQTEYTTNKKHLQV
eukprot:7744819-Ditylum_brightwellii.AAC.1